MRGFAELCQQRGADLHAGVFFTWFAALPSVPGKGTQAAEAQAATLWSTVYFPSHRALHWFFLD